MLLNSIITQKVSNFFQICRNINRIKVCMETGQTVILLNLENLYESLYDALNQVRVSVVRVSPVNMPVPGQHRPILASRHACTC